MSVDNLREEQAIRRTTDHLIQVFADTHSAEHVERVMQAACRRFEGFPVRDFVPVLAERVARGELTAPPETAAPAEAASLTETAARVQTAAPVQSTAPVQSVAPAEAVTSAETVTPAAAVTPDEASVEAASASVPRRKALLPIGVATAVVVVAAVVVVSLGQDEPATPATPPLTIVRGVIGSEKKGFFEDPQVVRALAGMGLKVEIETAGSRQIATSMDLGRYDFAFPSSAPAGEHIQRERRAGTKYTPFSSPMAIATFQPIADLLTEAGVVRQGQVPAFDVGRHLDLVTRGTKWEQLDGSTAYPVDKDVLISTTDPRTSNSAAMYLAITSYVANGGKVVHGAAAEKAVLPW
ncbi:three-helix bundle dimerization domain-containing protein [Nonomuraea thailandensis]